MFRALLRARHCYGRRYYCTKTNGASGGSSNGGLNGSNGGSGIVTNAVTKSGPNGAADGGSNGSNGGSGIVTNAATKSCPNGAADGGPTKFGPNGASIDGVNQVCCGGGSNSATEGISCNCGGRGSGLNLGSIGGSNGRSNRHFDGYWPFSGGRFFLGFAQTMERVDKFIFKERIGLRLTVVGGFITFGSSVLFYLLGIKSERDILEEIQRDVKALLPLVDQKEGFESALNLLHWLVTVVIHQVKEEDKEKLLNTTSSLCKVLMAFPSPKEEDKKEEDDKWRATCMQKLNSIKSKATGMGEAVKGK